MSSSMKSLSPEMVQALTAAKVAIRSTAEMLQADIVDIYELGDDPNTKEPIQSVEVQIPGEEDIRRYVFKGTDTINHIFGTPDEKNHLSNLEYNDEGVPIKMEVPDVGANDKGVRWYQLKKSS